MNNHLIKLLRRRGRAIISNTFEYLLDGVFTTVFTSLLEDEPEIHEKSELIGGIMGQLVELSSWYTKLVRNEVTEAYLVRTLRQLESSARAHCCGSCYYNRLYFGHRYFIQHVLHQKDYPLEFYRGNMLRLNNCFRHELPNTSLDNSSPDVCSKIRCSTWTSISWLYYHKD